MWFGGLWGEDDAPHAGAPASASSSPSLRQQQASNEGEGDPKGASWFRSSPGYLLRVYGREVSAGVCACRTLCLCVCVGAFRWKAHRGRESARNAHGVAASHEGPKHQKWSRATQILMSSVVHNVVLHVCC